MQEINKFLEKLKITGTVIQIGEVDLVDCQIAFGEALDFDNYIKANQNKNLYFLAGVQEGTAGRAKDTDVVKKNHLCFDFDIRKVEKKDGRDCDDAQLLEKANNILNLLNCHEMFKTFSFAFLSGNGLHIYYFGNTIDITSPEVFKTGMELLVKEISEIAGFPADKACINAARLFRMPGSVNQKNNKRVVALAENEAFSPLLDKVQEIGELELEKKTKEIISSSVQQGAENGVYQAINAVPIQDIVCKLMGWRFDGKKHWYAPGSDRISACFLARDGNYVVHGGTNHFSDQQKGYSPFQFVRMKLGLNDKQTFEWFENENADIKKMADEAREKFSSKNKFGYAPDEIIHLAENEIRGAVGKEIKMDLNCIPPNTILYDFLNLYDGVTDAPDEFLVTVGLVGLASVMNEVWTPFGAQKLRPHLWAIIMAPSSRFRKTTVINTIGSIVINVDPSLVFSNEITPEVFLEHLSINPSGLFTFSEMGGFLKQAERSYMQGFKEMLANLYDSPELYTRTRKDKKGNPITFEIKNPTINILSASTADWFLKNAQESDIGSGFLPRFIFAHSRTKTKPTIHRPRQADKTERQKIIEDLSLINTEWRGEKNFSPESDKLYEEWAEGVEGEMNALENPQVDAFWTRLNVTCIKFALIGEAMLQVRQFHQDGSTQFNNCSLISEDAMRFAIKLADYYRQTCKDLVCHELIFSRFGQELKKIKGILIKNNNKMSRRNLLRTLRISGDYLDTLIRTLVDSGEAVITDETKMSGQKTQIVHLVN